MSEKIPYAGTILLIRGVPGRGKSTLAELLATLIGAGAARHLEADQFHMISGQYRWDASRVHAAHQWCQNEAEREMAQKRPLIIVSNTFTRNREIEPYIQMAKNLNYRYIVVTVESGHPVEALAGRNVHNVPLEVLQQMAGRWENFSE